jgi:hypothetical protein
MQALRIRVMAEGLLTALSIVLTQAIGWGLFAVCAVGLIAEGALALSRRRKWGSLHRWDLQKWLDERIGKIESWAVALDEEAAKPIPDFDRVRKIEERFWWKLVPDIADKLESSESEKYWEETHEGYQGLPVCRTPVDVANLGQFLRSTAGRLRHIKEGSTPTPKPPAADRRPAP